MFGDELAQYVYFNWYNNRTTINTVTMIPHTDTHNFHYHLQVSTTAHHHTAIA